MPLLSLILAAIVGAAILWGFAFLLGRLQQQRAQVLEMRGTNVTLFGQNQNLGTLCTQLQEQLKQAQSGPVSVALGYTEMNKLAEVIASMIDGKMLGGKVITKKDVN